jgi:hypothetical protein
MTEVMKQVEAGSKSKGGKNIKIEIRPQVQIIKPSSLNYKVSLP